MYDKLIAINGSRTNWKVKVRVTRMWPSISHDGNTLIKWNLILLDSEDYHVHASIYPDAWILFGNRIIEGNLYEISNFLTKVAAGIHRPVSSPMSVILTTSSILQHVVDDNISIPRHKFELICLNDVYKLPRDGNNFNTIDVIGVIQDLEPAKVLHSTYGEETIVRFNLNDGRNSFVVTFWGEQVTLLDPLWEMNLENPTIILLASVRAWMMFGLVQLSTVESSKIYINLDHDAVNSFRRRLNEERYLDGKMLAKKRVHAK